MSGIPFFVWELATGRIDRQGGCSPNQLQFQAQPGEIAEVGTANDSMHYVDVTWPDETAVMPKKATQEAIVVTGLVVTFSNLPIPCRVKFHHTFYDVSDGELEITCNMPGEYKGWLESLEFLTKEFTVTL